MSEQFSEQKLEREIEASFERWRGENERLKEENKFLKQQLAEAQDKIDDMVIKHGDCDRASRIKAELKAAQKRIEELENTR